MWQPSRCSLASGAPREAEPLRSPQRAEAPRLREIGPAAAPAAAPLAYKGRAPSEGEEWESGCRASFTASAADRKKLRVLVPGQLDSES